MPLAPNYNYDLEKEQLARRQKMIEAMQASALQPMQMPQNGPVASKMSPLQALMPMAQAFLAAKMQDGLKEDQDHLATRYNTDLVEGMKKFYDTSNGATKTTNLQGPQEDGSALEGSFQTTEAPNRRKAIFDALASNHPVLKELAMNQLAAENKNALTTKDILSLADFDPNSRLAAAQGGDLRQLKGKKDVKEAAGNFFDVSGDKPRYLGGVEYSEPFDMRGDLYVNDKLSGLPKKLDNAPKVTIGGTSVAVDQGKKEGMKTYWESAAKKVDSLGQLSTTAQNNLQSIAELRNLDAKGIYSNVTTAPATFLSNLGQVVGIPVDTSKLANTENFNSITKDLWQGLVAKYGGNRGVTQEEAKQIQELLPLAAQSPQARQQLYSILEDTAKRQMAQYHRANRAYAKAVKMDDPEAFAEEFGDIYNPTPNTPSPALPAAGKKPTVSNW